MNKHFFAIGLGILVSLSSSHGQCLSDELRLQAQDGQAGDQFGAAVQFFGDMVIIGAPLADGAQSRSGAVYVFEDSGTAWSQVAKFWPNDGMTGDEFGRTLASDGETLLIGAPLADGAAPRSGAAYVFTELSPGTWAEETRLSPPTGGTGDLFAHALSVHQDWIVGGAPENDTSGLDAGAAYVFSKSSGQWEFHEELTTFDITPGELFGFAVSVEIRNILVGAPRRDVPSDRLGVVEAYFEEAGQWSLGSTITPPGTERRDFGYAITIDRGLALIGHPGTAQDAGAATSYSNLGGGTWRFQESFNLTGRSSGDRGGSAVALDRPLFAVGSPLDDLIFTSDVGSIFALCPFGCPWGNEERVMPRSTQRDARVGTAVDVQGSFILAGAPHADGMGAAYLFFEGPEGLPYGQPTAGSGGFDPQISIDGCGGFGATAEARQTLGGASGLLLIGFLATEDSSAGWTLLVDLLGPPPGLAIPVQYNGEGEGQGEASFLIDAPPNPFLHGLEVYFQFVVMDPGATNGIAATEGQLVYLMATG